MLSKNIYLLLLFTVNFSLYSAEKDFEPQEMYKKLPAHRSMGTSYKTDVSSQKTKEVLNKKSLEIKRKKEEKEREARRKKREQERKKEEKKREQKIAKLTEKSTLKMMPSHRLMGTSYQISEEQIKEKDRLVKQEKLEQKQKQEQKSRLMNKQQKKRKEYFESDKKIKKDLHKNNLEPYTTLAKFDASYFFGNNLQLLNSKNSFDNYSFIQYTLDAGIYVHPHHHYAEDEILEFKALARMKGNAGNPGRYTQTERTKTKIGWAITEADHSYKIDRLLFSMRELWFKYYFDKNKTSFFSAGYFPYSIGHGIALGYGHYTGQPLPGQYTLEDVDQFRPGLLLTGAFPDRRLVCEMYLGTIATRSDTYNATAAFINGQSLQQTGKIYRGPWKSNYVVAAQVTCEPKTSAKTKAKVSPFLVFNHDNGQKVEFENDATSKLLTFGCFAEWENGPLTFSIETARNFGSQKVRNWDRNVFHFGAQTFNTHLLFMNPSVITSSTTPAYPSIGVVTGEITPSDYSSAIQTVLETDTNYTPAIGVTNPHDYSRNFGNGVIFGLPTPTGATPATIVYKNSYNRFRNAYTNSYEGWFLIGDAVFRRNNWQLGSSFGIISGDNCPNDSEDFIMAARRTTGLTYKDTDKDYKGFVGIQEMFKSKAIDPFFIHEVEKLNRPLSASSYLTKPMLSNLMFWGVGYTQHNVHNNRETIFNTNAIVYYQHKQIKKGTNLPYSDIENLTFTTAQQEDRLKVLDTFLGIELNTSLHHQKTHDLDMYCAGAIFIPGGHYSSAEGKYIPIKDQINFTFQEQSGIRDKPEHFDITLGKDIALFFSAGFIYEFDSLFLRKKQEFYKLKN